MAIKIRRGNSTSFDPNKLVAGELGLVLDTGELYFCYAAGNSKKLATTNDLQTMLNASATTYAALQQCISDLNNNPSELANILSNISALQSGKIDKTSITQTTAANDATKVPSSVVTYELQQQVTTINDNLVKISLPRIIVGEYIISDAETLTSALDDMINLFGASKDGTIYPFDILLQNNVGAVTYGGITYGGGVHRITGVVGSTAVGVNYGSMIDYYYSNPHTRAASGGSWSNWAPIA
jgi:hypothetical protein